CACTTWKRHCERSWPAWSPRSGRRRRRPVSSTGSPPSRSWRARARRWPPGGWPTPISGGARVSAPPPTGWRDGPAPRWVRPWRDPDGAGRLDGRFTPEVLAELLVALEPFEAEAFRAARAEGRRETFDAYRADALVALARAGRDGSGGASSGPRHTVHVVI